MELVDQDVLLSHAGNNDYYSINVFNQTNQPYNVSLSLFDLLETQVNKNKDKLAIIDEKESLTFSELLFRVNKLASYLCERGISEQKAVGIFIHRSSEAIISIFALLKLGAIFVPLDPSYPAKRTQYMIENSKIEHILAISESGFNLNKHLDKLIYIDTCIKNNDNLTYQSILPLKSVYANAIYLLYTSGSTGQAKGVLGTQIGLLNRCYWMWEAYPFTEEDVCCQKTSLNFVDSLWEIFGSLLYGIKLEIVSEKNLRNIRRFKNQLNQAQVTRLVLVPSLLEVLLEHEDKINSLRLCISSGEALSASLVKKFKNVYPEAKLLNLYGSTEVAGDVTCYDTTEWSINELTVPIGKPISNTSIYILDENMQPLPLGGIGKIYVDGLGVAMGYWQNEVETKQKFLNNPQRDTTMYCMGDLGRYCLDGTIEYLGRNDEQVKIRGVRVELGEIRNLLLDHPMVKNAAMRILNKEKNVILMAYVTSSQIKPEQRACFSQELLEFLKERLPSPSVPNAIIIVEKFPLMPNGKVNLNLLPDIQDV